MKTYINEYADLATVGETQQERNKYFRGENFKGKFVNDDYTKGDVWYA